MHCLSQLLLLLFVTETFCNQIDWCLYFKLRNIERPECKYYDVTRERPAIKKIIERLPNKEKFRKIASLPSPSMSIIPPSQPIVSSMTSFKPPICSAYSKHCTYSTMCDGGMQRCVDMMNFRECCSTPERICPPPSSFGFKCLVKNPVSWCQKDSDCGFAPYKKCCPTGCNYNICL